MYYNELEKELSRLNFEDLIWFIYGSIIFINILGNYYEKEYLKNHNKIDGIKANSIFEIVLILTFFIYIYFLHRNYNNYKKASFNEKKVYFIRLIGSIFLICGILFFIYFQDERRTNLI